MDANTPYEILKFLGSKSGQDGYLTADNYMLIINEAQRDFLSYLLGEFQQYQYQRPIAKVELGMSERVLQTLAPFIDQPTTLTVDAGGFVAYPVDYEQIVAMNWNTSFKRVRFVQQDSWFSYVNSRIDPVATNPIYRITKNGFTFAPTNIGTVYLTYVSTPPDIVWGYTYDINGNIIYDPTTSVAPLWYDADMLNIITRAAQMLGINLQENDVEQYATMVKNFGQ